MNRSETSTRRAVLKLTGSSFATIGVGDQALATGRYGPPTFNVGYDAESGRRAAIAAASRVEREFGFDAVTVRGAAASIRRLGEREDVRYVEENGRMRAFGHTTPWGVERVDADQVHANGETGHGTNIAIVDSGIDSDHPDLAANLGTGKAVVECSGDCPEPWDDDHDHGTHCAGIAGAVDGNNRVFGVATDATLHAVKVLDKHGSGTASDVAAGIEWVADQGYAVAALSFGGDDHSVVEDAVDHAASEGVTMVAAAGSNGPCSDCVVYPAAYEEVIAVSATTCDDEIADFSATGPSVELAAPGKDVYSTVVDGYGTISGTSMACSHVAGAAGLLAADGRGREEIRSALIDNAEDVGLSNEKQGHGLVNAAATFGYEGSGTDC